MTMTMTSKLRKTLGVWIPAITLFHSMTFGVEEAKAASACDSISLSGADWRIHDDPLSQGVGQQYFNADLTGAGWIAAQVPGNIQADVEAAHLVGPLWYGAVNTNLYEVARKDWWYRKDFVTPATYAGRRITLDFEGVDEHCRVWLNGTLVGENGGMFRRFWFDVSGVALPGQTNHLAVQIDRMPEQLVPMLIGSDGPFNGPVFGLADRTRKVLKDLKAHGDLGFDWSANVWTLGIWKDVRITATGPARIDWMRVESTLASNYTHATVHATLEVDSLSNLPVVAEFCITGSGQRTTKRVDATLSKGLNLIKAELSLDRPALWWPNGQGEQPLYTIEAEIKLAGGGSVSDAHSTRFGIRELRWGLTEAAVGSNPEDILDFTGRSPQCNVLQLRWLPKQGVPANFTNCYQLFVNGRAVRTVGSAPILPYLLPGCGSAHGLQLLHFAKNAGMNFLRLNGGGGGPLFDEAWYDLADELGVMISYEYPVANTIFDSDPTVFSDPTALTNLEATCRSTLKQSRNHPSIVEYVGGSEMGEVGKDWNALVKSPAQQLMRKIAVEESDRLFRVTDPELGSKHGPWVFNILRAPYSYGYYNGNESDTMRYSEFGTASPANLEVWHREIPLASQWPLDSVADPILIYHNASKSAFTDIDWLYKPWISDAFGPLENLRDLVAAGQYYGAEGLRSIYDALRRKGKRIGGISNHTFSEPWPNAAGSYMIDYDGRPLMNYDFLKQALAPISLSLQFESCLYTPATGIQAELFLVSDAPAAVTGLRWHWLARDQNGNVFTHGSGTAGIQPIEVKSLTPLALQPVGDAAKGLVFVEMRLEDHSGKLLTERVQIFGPAIGRFAGLLKNEAKLVHAPLELPDGPDNLAYVGNGAKPATASSSRLEPNHQPRGLNDGKYGNGNSWIGTEPRSSFQIDLGKPALLGRFKLGRDRTAALSDRAADYLKIETSVDGRQWDPVFEQAGLSLLKGFGPEKTLVVQVIPVRAQFVKVMVEPSKSAPASLLACVDEFEVYAPANTPPVALPCVAFESSGWADPAHAVRRTSLTVVAAPPRFEGDQEVCALTVKNTGPMTALFCEPHPLLVYRTDLFIDNNNCFIPPGESRVITIRASSRAKCGLSLAQTGWTLSTWNADDVTVSPSAEIPLSVGRWDKMCREFLGYFDVNQVTNGAGTVCTGNRPDAGTLPYRLSGTGTVRFEFECTRAQAGRAARLRIHSADQAESAPTVVQITINGRELEKPLPKGLGIQRTDPAHRAFPATVEFDLAGSDLREGKQTNTLTVRVTGDGWFTWDALDLMLVPN